MTALFIDLCESFTQLGDQGALSFGANDEEHLEWALNLKDLLEQKQTFW